MGCGNAEQEIDSFFCFTYIILTSYLPLPKTTRDHRNDANAEIRFF
jgi:hypothetical protein